MINTYGEWLAFFYLCRCDETRWIQPGNKYEKIGVLSAKVLIQNHLSKGAKGYSIEYPSIPFTISQHSLPQEVY